MTPLNPVAKEVNSGREKKTFYILDSELDIRRKVVCQ